MNLWELATVVALSVLLVSAAVIAMAIGVIFKRPCLRGSCGGPIVLGPDGERISCSDCPNRDRQAETRR
jgi:hypothetical protein